MFYISYSFCYLTVACDLCKCMMKKKIFILLINKVLHIFYSETLREGLRDVHIFNSFSQKKHDCCSLIVCFLEGRV